MQNQHRGLFWLYLAPSLIAFSLTVAVPFLMGIYYSLTDWNAISVNYSFVGLANYLRLFRDPAFGNSFLLSVFYTLMSVILINAVGLMLAIFLTSRIRFKNLFRGIFFIPNMIGGLILGFIWQYVFVKAFPAVAELTGLLFLGVDWLGDKDFALFALVFVSTWQMAGYVMIIYIAGLQTIPAEIGEAADIAGASPAARFFRITLPMLMPAFTVCLFLTLTDSFKMFDTNVSLTNGGPYKSTELLALHIYNEAFGYNDFGYGQAQAVVFFLVIVIISIAQVSATKKREIEL